MAVTVHTMAFDGEVNDGALGTSATRANSVTIQLLICDNAGAGCRTGHRTFAHQLRVHTPTME